MTEGNSPGKDCQAAVADGTAGNNCRLAWQHNQTTSIKLYYENGAPKFRKIFPYLGKDENFSPAKITSILPDLVATDDEGVVRAHLSQLRNGQAISPTTTPRTDEG
jgi:hypothetical protein